MRARLPLLAAFALLGLLLTGCSGRERANPLDPANPVTGGRPEGFNAIAGFSAIALQWTAQPQLEIDGFVIERLAPGDSLYRPLAGVRPPETFGFTDTGTTNGLRYHYRLYYQIHGKLSAQFATDEATPGGLRPWVADENLGLVRLSPDGRDVIQQFALFGAIQSLDVRPEDGLVWMSDRTSARVTAYDPASGTTTSIPGVSSPFTVAVTPLDRSAWVCDLTGSLWHFRDDGSAATPGRIDLLEQPTGVAVNRTDYSVWVCENAGNRVRHFSPAGAPLSASPIARPSRVAVDSASGIAWVTSSSRGRIWRVGSDGTVLDSSAAAFSPLGVAVDRARGRVWVADPEGNRVLALDLATLALLVTVPGLNQPRDVAVDFATGEVWVVLQGDHAVLRLASSGQVLDRTDALSFPTEVRLDPGTR